MKKEMMSDGFSWRGLLIFLVLLFILSWGVWFVFFSYESCDSKICFDDKLKGCERVRFIGGNEMIFRYVIRGESSGACEVDIELLQGDLDNADSIKLEGRGMTCMLPLGAVVVPESDIGVCHGLLKEGLQDLIIRNLHSYLVENLGTLNLEMLGIPNV
ncbi:hypothetical protein HN903_00590 [archaeon]|jgi:hypothetical protein|nr:hypothetical protein [archaeon]MBT7128231.1 hypothetical protein [archaeon]